MTSRQGILKQFREITGASDYDAERYLEHCNYNLEVAVGNYLENPPTSGSKPASSVPGQQNRQNDDPAFMQQQIAMMQMFEREKTRPKPTGEGKASILVCEHVTPEGAKIQVRHGDMTEEQVGAIVNAANKYLDHASGLAGSIRSKGGSMIQSESDLYINKHGPLEEGAVVALSSGNLKCKHVIHAVGPMWHGGQYGEPVYLSMCIRGCLDKANELKVTSLSMPAISTGIFKFPKPTCADIMFSTVLHYFQEVKGNTNIQEVRFTNFDDDTVFVFKTEFEKRFGIIKDEVPKEGEKDKNPENKEIPEKKEGSGISENLETSENLLIPEKKEGSGISENLLIPENKGIMENVEKPENVPKTEENVVQKAEEIQ